MKQKTILFAAAVFILIAGRGIARAETVIVHDALTVWGAGAGYQPAGPGTQFSPGPVPYHASSSFAIIGVLIGQNRDGSINNHDGVGLARAWLYDAQGNALVSSTNYCYIEGGCVGIRFLFPSGIVVPQDFELGFAVDDGIQGNGGAQFVDVTIFGDPKPPREPVVIIPGIMGSRLNASSGEEIWPNVTKMVGSLSDDYLDALKGDQNIYAPDIVRDATGTFLGIPIGATFYGNLINKLAGDGYVEGKDLFVAPYDWRQDISLEASALGSVITQARAASPDGKINIIAHSMGGLLAERYLSGQYDTSFVDKLVLVGVPQLGSPKDFSILNYGDDLGLSWIGLFGLNAGEVKSISQDMPAIYQLLPSRRYFDVAGSYVHDFRNGSNTFLGYDETTALMTSDPGDSRNPTFLAEADMFHQGSDSSPIRASKIYNIVGCSDPTIAEFDLYNNGVVDVKRGNGDGVVPAVSAMNLANGYENYFVMGDATGIDHLGLVKDVRPLALLASILDDATSSGPLPEGISSRSIDCFDPRAAQVDDSALEVSAHGPVTLDVFDASGNHTGMYEKFGKNTFVMLPASSTYKIIASTTAASTTATVRVRRYRKNTVSRIAMYTSVPFINSSTQATLDIDPGVDLPLTLNDATSVPPAVLIEPSSTILPPPSPSAPPASTSTPQIPTSTAPGPTSTIPFPTSTPSLHHPPFPKKVPPCKVPRLLWFSHGKPHCDSKNDHNGDKDDKKEKPKPRR